MYFRFFHHAVICLFVICVSHFASAQEVQIEGVIWHDGSVTQGGLITAQLPQGSRASLDDKQLPQTQDGYIAFGFHRDDDQTNQLHITTADNQTFITALTPLKRSYKTQSITGLESRYVSPPKAVLDRIARDKEQVAQARARTSLQDGFAKSGFNWPVKGTITGIYGSQRILNGKPRAPHYGIDIAAPIGTPVYAPAQGNITLVEDLYYTGWTIIIDHGLGISSTMLHLSSVEVAKGTFVKAGDIIGRVGSTGRSTGPHLDWRLNWYQKRLDPQLVTLTAQP